MNDILTDFRVKGLHGYKNVAATLDNDTLIVVGENGSGKTTFLRLLFLFISGRWNDLLQFQFDGLEATIRGTTYGVNREQLLEWFKGRGSRILANLPPIQRRRIQQMVAHGEIDLAQRELHRAGLPVSLVMELQSAQLELFDASPSLKEYRRLVTKIRVDIDAQILYLPTYRRIEHELGKIIDGIDPDDVRRRAARFRQDEEGSAFIELVEFGMKDVERAVTRALEKLKEFARESLNALTLNYLGDIVNKQYDSIGIQEFRSLPDDFIRSVLDRTDNRTLSETSKRRLMSVMTAARDANAPSEHEKIVYHYFAKLLEFQRSLQESERRITDFCELCSGYVVGKSFVYDGASFAFTIVGTGPREPREEIKLSDLSSGEKQIVSLFSHLYLSGAQGFFVLIDEPELSLSVPWQRRFLVDVRNGTFCKGLVAVTHSPFIYDNEMHSYARAIGEFAAE